MSHMSSGFNTKDRAVISSMISADQQLAMKAGTKLNEYVQPFNKMVQSNFHS